MATTMNKENSAGVVGNSNAAAVVQQKQQKPADAKAGGKAMSIEAFDIGRQLGRGKYGSVYLARVKANKRIVAIKVMFKQQVEENGIQHQIKREIEIQSRLKHAHILKLRGFFTDEKRVYMVMEYAKHGSMYDMLQKNGPLDEDEARRYIQQMCSALFLLQKCHIIHRDLKLENIMIGDKDGKTMIKLGDFGWAVNAKNGFRAEADRRQTFCGTLDYLAPEMVSGGTYDEKIDMWSLGVLAFEFMHGSCPFAGDRAERAAASDEEMISGTCSRIISGEFVFPQDSEISQGARNFISRLLTKDPVKRMSLKQAIAHPWMLESITDSKKFKDVARQVAAIDGWEVPF
eukprot:INCI5239.1.p1 GENE.INCI5239.1~~INCI5239.1.p1  ORF type:complete len:345 (+),score=82.52 INCI5239.1:62-1096(+)